MLKLPFSVQTGQNVSGMIYRLASSTWYNTLWKILDCIIQMKKSERGLANKLFLKMGDGLSKINEQPGKVNCSYFLAYYQQFLGSKVKNHHMWQMSSLKRGNPSTASRLQKFGQKKLHHLPAKRQYSTCWTWLALPMPGRALSAKAAGLVAEAGSLWKPACYFKDGNTPLEG